MTQHVVDTIVSKQEEIDRLMGQLKAYGLRNEQILQINDEMNMERNRLTNAYHQLARDFNKLESENRQLKDQIVAANTRAGERTAFLIDLQGQIINYNREFDLDVQPSFTSGLEYQVSQELKKGQAVLFAKISTGPENGGGA